MKTVGLELQLQNPHWFVPRLGIITDQGEKLRLRELHAEQRAVLDMLHENSRICILKPRQIGCTTIVMAYLFWLLWSRKGALSCLSITHESGAVGRVNKMIRHFWQSLPPPLQGGHPGPDNAHEFGLPHNGAVFRQVMAGGRGQGRSYTYQVLHGTEMAFWPKGSAVMRGNNLDRDVWASALSTVHPGKNTKVIVESTGDGPVGIFYDTVKRAMATDDWAFLFFPWSQFGQYRRELPDRWRRTLEDEDLVKQFGLTDEQLCWRRYKLEVEGYDLNRFRKEYPLSWQDPFLLSEGMWFNVESLNRIAGAIPLPKGSRKAPLTVYEEPVASRKYFLGLDTAGGTGRDFAVIQVLRDDLTQVAVWRSNQAKPHEQADMACQLSARYNRGRILCEKNNFGESVIKHMAKLGGFLWKDSKGNDFWTQGGKAGRTKKMMYDWAAKLVDAGHVGLNDPVTVAELLTIKEMENGNIEADGDGHDDHSDALALALWNGRRQFDMREHKPETPFARKLRRHRELMGVDA